MEKSSSSSSYRTHFFQPILPNSSSAHFIPIPKAFQRDYLIGREDSEGVATHLSPLKSWKVKLNEFRFTDGWAEFFKSHELIEYALPTFVSAENEIHHGDQKGAVEVNEGGTGTSICISKYPYFTTTLEQYNIGRSYLVSY
ncbi:hypothetical protein MKW94_015045 [Papaver nudicaule]|uniref:Uncharacterized protein n=1 Tax=Papaver nudicaule TaxID=74823 RepID=A0AA41RVR8_PAPNU|nr:hypothetical protein [Papaver nudicaule]